MSEKNPHSDLLATLRSQFGKMKREIQRGDAGETLARIEALDAMVEVIQCDVWELRQADEAFDNEIRDTASTTRKFHRCLDDGEVYQTGDQVYDVIAQDWVPIDGERIGDVFHSETQHPVRREIVGICDR